MTIAHADVPPCHDQHGEHNGSNLPTPSNACSEGPALETKISPALKCSLLIVDLPSVVSTAVFTWNEAWQEMPSFPVYQESGALSRSHVLRI